MLCAGKDVLYFLTRLLLINAFTLVGMNNKSYYILPQHYLSTLFWQSEIHIESLIIPLNATWLSAPTNILYRSINPRTQFISFSPPHDPRESP